MRKLCLSDDGYGDEDFYSVDEFESNKERKKHIMKIEQTIRTSDEYKRWVAFIHGVLGVGFVCYNKGYPPTTCKLEIHHYPWTLYELVECIMNTRDEYTTFEIANDVMSLHYKNMVGFVPLNKTDHDRYHSGEMLIPIEVVEGDYQRMVSVYPSQELKHTLLGASSTTMDRVGEPWFIQRRQYVGVSTLAEERS